MLVSDSTQSVPAEERQAELGSTGSTDMYRGRRVAGPLGRRQEAGKAEAQGAEWA